MGVDEVLQGCFQLQHTGVIIRRFGFVEVVHDHFLDGLDLIQRMSRNGGYSITGGGSASENIYAFADDAINNPCTASTLPPRPTTSPTNTHPAGAPPDTSPP